MALWRRIGLWMIPGVLLAALAWSLIPHGARPPGPDLSRATRDETRPADAQGPIPIGPDGRPSKEADEGTAGARRPRSVRVPGPEDRITTETPPRGAAQRQDSTTAPRAGVATGEIRAGTLVGTDETGRRRWQIRADDVVLARGRQVVELRNVRATFYNADGTQMTVTGARGRYDTQTREVDIEGQVHGAASNGREIFADALHYSPATQQVTGNGHIRVVEERVVMYADHMTSNTALGQTRFFGHVRMTVR